MIDVYKMRAGYELTERTARALGWIYEPRFEGDVEGYWITPGGTRFISEEMPALSEDMTDCWQWVVAPFRDQWTAATEHCTPRNPNFTPPFDDGYFFDVLHRYADRRWPWAFLYITPEAICRAAIMTLALYQR